MTRRGFLEAAGIIVLWVGAWLLSAAVVFLALGWLWLAVRELWGILF